MKTAAFKQARTTFGFSPVGNAVGAEGQAVGQEGGKPDALKEKFQGIFKAEWNRALFLNFTVNAAELQPYVPYELDLYEGKAIVTLVAFTMENFRPRKGPHWLAKFLQPFGSHDFLNIRTYVKQGEKRGIFFLREVVPSKLSRALGPVLFGLPYRLGKTDYGHTGWRAGRICTKVKTGWGDLDCSGFLDLGTGPGTVTPGHWDEFVMERYHCFTQWLGLKRRFQVAHRPWRGYDVRVTFHADALLRNLGPWAAGLEFMGAQFFPTCRDVNLGAPHFS